ncbi:MAG: dehydrogenase [Novosphingobium sp. 28-62-57]|uniref:SDR family NAD(P)-dependent oxidoreductase n=1 Tax=unclassified Novosphingobium TaxID=2644732 RepID=UPI000BDC67D8|nr:MULTISPECIES: SDR family NAD(P)-dependent oxidoreductase [unclassified Novosphingobium]OYW51310.1 MAG: dehydrogenase [Novosphingobium sp. 12-62-10]OYZ38804.1 MAG: dehydrogenase [Novosphingobium sp. 16-62-11]OZA40318.1 MAG: dehydrogenase [Novosphingobium sp. 17-62-9]OYZ10552.1 MAG: dehydrogenase [Novosphingobium sp. 28-62-57]HQS68024.1 SDR family NAD(P)-dependent oxidoreductase [Novosphingobium sp.]
MQSFENQIAFITGGASGAGFGQAQVFGRAGAKIVVADIRAEAVAKAVADLTAEGITAHGITLDIMDRAAYAAAADEVEAVFGAAPTLLFNTAGVNSFGPVENTSYDDFDWIIGVNLGGVINGMVTFVPRMIASGKPGHIVTTSSVGGLMGSALAAPYSAAKAAVVNLMEGYRMGLEKYQIGVSVLCPANIKSNIAEASKLRPAQFGQSGYVENEDSIASLHSIHQHGMDPVELAQHVKAAIEANQLYVIPYPEMKDALRAHFDAIVDSVLPLEADPEGARLRTEALQNWAADRARVFMEKQGAK